MLARIGEIYLQEEGISVGCLCKAGKPIVTVRKIREFLANSYFCTYLKAYLWMATRARKSEEILQRDFFMVRDLKTRICQTINAGLCLCGACIGSDFEIVKVSIVLKYTGALS